MTALEPVVSAHGGRIVGQEGRDNYTDVLHNYWFSAMFIEANAYVQ